MRCLVLLLALGFGLPAAAAGLRWDAARRTLDADLERAPLGRVLQQLAGATGWEILVEPGTERAVSARFEGQREGPALNQLLEGVSYLALPTAGGGRKLLVYRTNAGGATQRVKPAAGDDGHDGRTGTGRELLVSLKAGTSAEELAQKLGAAVTGKIDGLDVYRLEFADAEAARAAADTLATTEGVEGVEFNQAFPRPETPELLAGVPALNFELNAKPVGADGKIIVALVDTAVPAGGKFADWLLPQISLAGPAAANSGEPGHGAAMLETLLQAYALAAADGAKLPVRVLPIDVYGAGGVTTTFDVANAVARAAREGADVINLSLGGAEPSALLQRVLRQAVEAGALPVAAAGNQPTTAPTYPAAYGETLAVTAGDRRGAVASYANRGEFVDVIAPGTSIVDHNGRAYVVSGTSAATASVSGLATALAATGQPMTDVRTALEQKLKFIPPTEAPKRP